MLRKWLCLSVLWSIGIFGSILCPAIAKASDIYIAQGAAGANNGTSCANAYATTFFNKSSNWGSGSNQIGAGTTVHLCGALTSSLTAYGSGSSGKPITILFDSASKAQFSVPAVPYSGAIVLGNNSYITIDGNHTGIIQSTSNGSASSLCSGSPYTNSVMSTAVKAGEGSNITVQNLTIGPLYVHVCPADDSSTHSALSPPGPTCITGGGNNLTVLNNTMHDMAWCIFGGGNGLTVGNNTIYNIDHGVGLGIDAASGTISGVYFYGNTVYGTNVWDTNDNTFHHDGFHGWAYCADGSSYCSGTTITNLFIYNNTFKGQWGNNINAPIFLEENIGTAYVFNNYLDGSNMVGWGTGLCLCEAQTLYDYNNTLVGFSTTDAIPPNMHLITITATVKNNILMTANSLIGTAGVWLDGSKSSYSLSNNLYANGGGNAFVWCPSSGNCDFYGSGQFSSWLSTSRETGSSYRSSSSGIINSDGTLTSTSPARGGGTNLYSICNGQPNPGLGALCYDAAGNARVASGAWDAGAFNSSPSVSPAAPTNLSGSVR